MNMNNFETFGSIKVNKILYRSSYIIHVLNNLENNPVSGIISAVLLDKKNYFFFNVQPLDSIFI